MAKNKKGKQRKDQIFNLTKIFKTLSDQLHELEEEKLYIEDEIGSLEDQLEKLKEFQQIFGGDLEE